MLSTIYNPIFESDGGSFSINIFLREEFKAFIDQLIQKLEIAERFKPRRYRFSDYIFVKFYAILDGSSLHHASEYLNFVCKDILTRNDKFNPMIFKDKVRERRVIPHQTDVDKFFRLLNENEVIFIFRSALDRINSEIMKSAARNRSFVFIADNTKFPYYGNIDQTKHIKAPYLPGTKYCWMYQGISIHSSDIHLFTNFHSITKGIYRCKDIPDDIAWLQFLNLRFNTAVFDREFYRAALVADCGLLQVETLIPTKKYPWVKHRMMQFLAGKGDMISGNVFSQTFKHYPNQRSVFVKLVLIGHDGQSCYEVRDKYLQNRLTFDEALTQLAGFYTTMKPWKNKRAWARYLARTYKRRWNIETGFSKLNEIHKTFHNRKFTIKLAENYIRAWIYNSWQAWHLTSKKNRLKARDITEMIFIRSCKRKLEDLIRSDLLNRV